MVVMLACGYSVGCNESAQTYYLSDYNLQQSIQYAESVARRKLGERVFLYTGSILGAAAGSDFNMSLTPHVQLKGNARWQTVGLNYSFRF